MSRRALLKQHHALQRLGKAVGSAPLKSIATHRLPPHADEASLYVHVSECQNLSVKASHWQMYRREM